MDHFVLGKRRVNCEIIEADVKGTPPDEDDFDENSQSLLDIVGAENRKVLNILCLWAWVNVHLLSSSIPLRS